jgi:RNA polymerase sigma-70 factor (ECF subfamily)
MNAVNDMALCLERVRSNDQVAAKELYDYLYPLVIKIVKSRLPWRSSAEDLTQEVYKKVFTRIGQYIGSVPFHHWVSRIAVSTCIDHLRAQRRRPEYRWADLSETEAEELETNLSKEYEQASNDEFSNKELVDMMLEKLNPKEQLLVRLVYMEQKNCSEVAALTGWGKSTIKVKAFRVRQKLHKLYLELKKEEQNRN